MARYQRNMLNYRPPVHNLDEVENLEVVASVVKKARAAGPGKQGARIISEVKAEYPELPKEAVLKACTIAADIMLAQHFNDLK